MTDRSSSEALSAQATTRPISSRAKTRGRSARGWLRTRGRRTITWRSDRWNHGRYGSTDEVRQCGVRTPIPPVLRRRDEDIIGTVVAQGSMSLDGYIDKADNSIGRLFD